MERRVSKVRRGPQRRRATPGQPVYRVRKGHRELPEKRASQESEAPPALRVLRVLWGLKAPQVTLLRLPVLSRWLQWKPVRARSSPSPRRVLRQPLHPPRRLPSVPAPQPQPPRHSAPQVAQPRSWFSRLGCSCWERAAQRAGSERTAGDRLSLPRGCSTQKTPTPLISQQCRGLYAGGG